MYTERRIPGRQETQSPSSRRFQKYRIEEGGRAEGSSRIGEGMF
jgi:hypothetical protein